MANTNTTSTEFRKGHPISGILVSVRYHGPTGSLGSRLTAIVRSRGVFCATIPFPHELSSTEQGVAAVKAWHAKHAARFEARDIRYSVIRPIFAGVSDDQLFMLQTEDESAW